VPKEHGKVKKKGTIEKEKKRLDVPPPKGGGALVEDVKKGPRGTTK